MGKNPRKQPAPRKTKNPLVLLSPSALSRFAKTKLLRKTSRGHPMPPFSHQIRQIVDQEFLTCSICLQLLISPVQAQCGHSFCLPCAENLASHGFACGICHSHHPTYDLPSSSIIQTLIQDYLERSDIEEKELYGKRQIDLSIKQEKRLIGELQEGDMVDFWSEEELAWKNGTVAEKMKDGTLIITSRKPVTDLKAKASEVKIHSSSRRLAPYLYFSKEELPPSTPEVHMRPSLQLLQGQELEMMRMRIEERTRLLHMPHMPMFLGYYWRGGEDIMESGLFDSINPFN